MSDSYPLAGGSSDKSAAEPKAKAVVINNHIQPQSWLGRTLMRFVLMASIFGNIALFGLYQQYYPNVTANEKFLDGEKYAKPKVAVIKINHMILHETVKAPIEELKTAAEDADVRAVVLAIEDCPGGTITGSDELYKALVDFKEKTKRPLIVSMSGMATSGAYYVAMPADRIIADRSCITGSIGVIISLMQGQELMKKVGVDSNVFKSGAKKDAGSMYRPMTEEERKDWQAMIDGMYQQFVDLVLKHREEKITGGEKTLNELAGRVVLAEEAVKLGLIDEVGYPQQAIEIAKNLAGLQGEVRVVTYSRPAGVMDILTGNTKASTQTNVLSLETLLRLQTPKVLLMPTPVLGL